MKCKKQEKTSQEVEIKEDEDLNNDFFEEAPPFEKNITFYQMNLSRPILKVSLIFFFNFK